MPEGWTWDETLYRGSAPFYTKGRPPYAPGLADQLTEFVPLEGSERLLDVGCGPGVIALLLTDRVAEVVGVDPDAEMLAEAARRAEAIGVANARWVQARAEELPLDLGTFQIATFAISFHWMDRARVAAIMRGMLAPGGALVHIADVKNPAPWPGQLPHPRPPYDAIRALVQRYLGPTPRAGRGILRHGTPDDEAAVLSHAGFLGPERIIVPAMEPLVRDVEELVAWSYSLSGSAPHLFGADLPAFETELRRLLRGASPEGRFADPPSDTEVVIWRNPAE